MQAAKINLYVEQAATFSRLLTLTDPTNTPINLTGWVFSGEIRSTFGGSILGAFSFTLAAQSGGTVGQVTMTMPASVTSDLINNILNQGLASATYVYDVIATLADEVTVYRILQGNAIVLSEVTAS